jgi:23S rRNA pseudouridine2457 synthase
MIILLNKPFNVLCQFTDKAGRTNLSDYIQTKNVYAAGRLDYDSEGLVVLTDDGKIQNLISDPINKIPKTYWVQLEGVPDKNKLNTLRRGMFLRDGMTKPARARLINEPKIWERVPPIRQRKKIPTSWIELIINEGRNRQIRRMTAAIGYPTLRLVRYSIGVWNINGLENGESRIIKL